MADPRIANRTPVELGSIALLCIGLFASCTQGPEDGERTPAPIVRSNSAISFSDITEEAGVSFVHHNGASQRKFLPETMGSGVAVFDANGDHLPDLFFVDSADVESPAPGTPSARTAAIGALYLNRGSARFEDVTNVSGLAKLAHGFLGMGATVGDIDNDGDLDLLVTGVGGERLFLNRGNARFDEVSAAWALSTEGFSTSAAFVDVDRDGYLDLVVARYVLWSPAQDLPCRPDGQHRTYCTPESYPGATTRLYRNRSGRRFDDITEQAGLAGVEGKSLGIAVLDLDDDSWPDLAIANDTTRNFLYRNRGDGTFDEVAVEAGIGYGPSGSPRGAMGIDSGDVDGDGRPDLVIGNFASEMTSVYRQVAVGVFRDDAAALGVGLSTLMELTFGTVIADLDGDGWLDLVFVNGHIEPDVSRFQPAHRYAQPMALFRNRSGQGFDKVQAGPGSPLDAELVGRGLATGDLDGDGDLDLVVTQNGRSARILRNDSPPQTFLRLRLVGQSSNHSALGAKVSVAVEADDGPRTLHRWLTSGGSYLSASEPLLTIGLGASSRLHSVTILWPSGTVQLLEALALDRLHVIEEPSGPSLRMPPLVPEH